MGGLEVSSNQVKVLFFLMLSSLSSSSSGDVSLRKFFKVFVSSKVHFIFCFVQHSL